MPTIPQTVQPSPPDVKKEWLMVAVGLTALVSVLALIVALVAWSQSPSTDSVGSGSTPTTHGSMMAPAAAGGTGAAAVTMAKQSAGVSVVGVTMGEMFIHLTANTAAAGKVTFNTVNNGSVVHEMVVLRTDKPADSLGAGARVPETGSIGETGDVKVGEKKSVSFKMKPGHYALICNLPGHYAGGMHADFTVK
ncbi:MAG: sulfocyanin-like copper-binding protein [Actinomycetes bacterium]|jgi:uncharacterized cupredoxin-like copper-binding protein